MMSLQLRDPAARWWLLGRTQWYEQHGYNIFQATNLALRDWQVQEQLAAELEAQKK